MKGNFTAAVSSSKGSEEGKEVMMRAGTKQEFFEGKVFYGLNDAMVGKMTIIRSTKEVSEG